MNYNINNKIMNNTEQEKENLLNMIKTIRAVIVFNKTNAIIETVLDDNLKLEDLLPIRKSLEECTPYAVKLQDFLRKNL